MDRVDGKHIGYVERRRRASEEIREAWTLGGHVPDDPGLREYYEELPRAPVRVICCALGKDVNQGGILRLAEAFRIERVDYEPPRGNPYDFTAATGVEAWQPFTWAEPEEAIRQAKQDGYRVYGMTLSDKAVAVQNVKWQFPCALVLGEEKDGLQPESAALCDEHVGIPLFGLIPSINVSTAAAIGLYEVIRSYCLEHPEFAPGRNASRLLLNLEPADYSHYLTQNETF